MKKIIIAEDSVTMRHYIKICLKNVQGAVVTESSDGLEAIERIKKERFDLLITDLQMPNMGGLELIENIRAMGLQIPIIILTTRGDEDDVKKGLMLGANDYLTKPVSSHKFNSLIHNYMAAI